MWSRWTSKPPPWTLYLIIYANYGRMQAHRFTCHNGTTTAHQCGSFSGWKRGATGGFGVTSKEARALTDTIVNHFEDAATSYFPSTLDHRLAHACMELGGLYRVQPNSSGEKLPHSGFVALSILELLCATRVVGADVASPGLGLSDERLLLGL
jgi:hypothetical protein